MTRRRFAGKTSPSTLPAEGALLAAGFAVVFFVASHGLLGDDVTRFRDIQELLDHGHLTDSKYSLVMPIASAPFLLLGRIVESPEWWAARFNVLVVAAGAVAAWRVLRGRSDPAVLRRTLLVLLAASLLANRLRDYNAEVFSATLVALGILCIVTDRHTLLGWAGIVVACVNTPAAIVALVPLVAAEALRTRRLRPLAAVPVAVALVLVESWVRRGGPLTTGYGDDHGVATLLPYSGRPGFSYPFVLGVLSILFSFGRGLLFFAPGLALWLDGRTRRAAGAHRRAVVLMLLFVAGLVVVYAKWWAWYGGVSWGPRFFVFAAIPASLLVVLRLRRVGESLGSDAALLVVLAVSAWVGAAGLTAYVAASDVCVRSSFAFESFCWYVPEFSSLWRPVIHHPPLTAANAVIVGWCASTFLYSAAPLAGSLLRMTAKRAGRG
jgi:hypothetical protein